MTASELVEKYLGKHVVVENKSGIGVVYAILMRPDQYGSLLKIAFTKMVDEPIPSLDDAYNEVLDDYSMLSCPPSLIICVLCEDMSGGDKIEFKVDEC